jgi:hypothetical protein
VLVRVPLSVGVPLDVIELDGVSLGEDEGVGASVHA